MARRFTPRILSQAVLILGFSAILPLVDARAAGVDFDSRFTKITEEATPDPVLRFQYRLWPSAEVTETAVAADGAPIEARVSAFSDNPLNTSALMILVDTSVGSSRTPRNATIESNKEVILDILNAVQPRTQVGVYAFANDLKEIAPLGTPASETRQKVAGLKADGMGTRLYRRAMDAIEKLSAAKVDRKALLIFSDGQDEDTGYTLANLQEAASKANVIVMTVGCPENAQDIPALGNLERLAQEAQGFYAQMELPVSGKSGPTKNPPGLGAAILASLDGGGEVVASLKDVKPDGVVTVTLATKDGQKLEKSLTRVPPATPTPSPSPTPEGSPTPEASPSPDATPTATPEPTPIPTKIEAAAAWAKQNQTWVIVGVMAVLALLGIIIAAVATRKKPNPPPEDDAFSDPILPTTGPGISVQSAALAYLVMQDADGTRLAITKTASRIGRRSDNDIVFSNDSVSGHHAELHMSREGAFSITDLGSGNGIVLNGKKVTQGGLRDGDLVELGEVRFRFSLSD